MSLAYERREYFDDARVELLAGVGFDLVHGFLEGHRFLVARLARNRVEDFADRDDPRFERNLFSCDSVRVASAVPAFVMVLDEWCKILPEDDATEHAGTQCGVRGGGSRVHLEVSVDLQQADVV